MITVGMNYHVIAGKQARVPRKVQRRFAWPLAALPATPTRKSRKDTNDDASYLITSEWSDEKAFADFIGSQAL